jgi:predicted TPR repeat methyltransferase
MYNDSWKNKNVFQKQLELNKKELLNYPEHWRIFIEIISNLLNEKQQLNLLDIGCGCGTFYKICQDNFKQKINYQGMDYSSDSIELAKSEWKYDKFICKDLFEINDDFIKNIDIIHMGALLDVLPNGDEALNFILSFDVPYLYFGRMDIVETESTVSTYRAYDEIMTYKYKHGRNEFMDALNNHSYKILNIKNNNILVGKKYD